jgi:histone H3/H4
MAQCGGKEMLVVGSKVKAHIKAKGLMCSSDVLEAINCCVYCCLDKAAKRAEANGRKTVQARDV